MHARGLRLRGVLRVLALAHPSVLPSAMMNDVGTPIAIISQLHTLSACAPVNASMAASRLATHDSGQDSLLDLSCMTLAFTTPRRFYPGALISLLGLRGASIRLWLNTTTERRRQPSMRLV